MLKIKSNVDFKELEKLVEPIQKWILKNYDCMCKIIIEDGKIEIIRLEAGFNTKTKMN